MRPQQLDRVLAPEEQDKLAPYFQSVVARQRLGLRPRAETLQGYQSEDARLQSHLVRYDAVVYTDDAAAVEGTGAQVHARFDGFVTARLSARALAATARLASVSYVDPGALSYPANDMSVPATGAHLLHGGFVNGTAYRGAGAIVCVFDTGVDFTHADFADAEGRSRILSLWDQTLAPQGTEASPEKFAYGVEYTQTQINDEIDGSPAGFVRQRDVNGHGTHVAGTAAGNGRAYNGIYRGMAPEADLVIVKGGDNSFSMTRIIDGISYCGEKAEAAGRPVVVNLSLGGQAGPHDGTRADAQAISQFVQTPGRAVVVAAGNDGARPIHVGGAVPADGGTFAVQIEVPEGRTPVSGIYNDRFLFDGWFDGAPSDLTATITSPPVYDTDGDGAPDSSVTATYAVGDVGPAPADTAGTVFVEHRSRASIGGGDLHTEVQVYDGSATKPPAAGIWTLTFQNNTGSAVGFHGWLAYTSGSARSATLIGGDTERTTAMPGTSSGAITAGNYVGRQVWPSGDGHTYGSTSRPIGQIAASSALGPTRDGRTKPELAAPGTFIVSSKSEALSTGTSVVPGGAHRVLTGTSMAAPHVAGALALLLAEHPNKTAADLSTLLQRTAAQDDFTGAQPNDVYGAGKLDAFGAMVEAMGGVLAERDRYGYADDAQSLVSTQGSQRYAVQFAPTASGRFTGFDVDIAWQGSGGAVGVQGSGDLVYTLHADDGSGLPGPPLTAPLRKPLTEVSSSSITHFSALGAPPEHLSVQAGRTYHIVFYTEAPDDVLEFYATGDGGTAASALKVGLKAGSTTSRSAAYDSGVGRWAEADQFFGAPAEFRVWPEVTRTDDAGPLPVELAAFDASLDRGDVVLRWRTLSETNNAGFGVEHAPPAGGGFAQVRFVEGAGTTTEAQRYKTRLGRLDPGTHRFRLRQVDLDGMTRYSNEVQISVGLPEAYRLSAAYPNPFALRARLKLSVARTQRVRVSVYDVLGRRVRVLFDSELPALEAREFSLEADALPSGLYFIRVKGEDFAASRRAILVR